MVIIELTVQSCGLGEGLVDWLHRDEAGVNGIEYCASLQAL